MLTASAVSILYTTKFTTCKPAKKTIKNKHLQEHKKWHDSSIFLGNFVFEDLSRSRR
jgi:hypothetical protein